MTKFVNIATAFFVMILGILLWFSWKRTVELQQTVARMSENYKNTSPENPENDDGSTRDPYEVLDQKLRNVEQEINRMKKTQNSFQENLSRKVNQSKSSGQNGSSNTTREEFLENLLKKAREREEEQMRRSIQVDAILEDFEPASRERVERFLNRRLGEENELNQQQLDDFYSIYTDIEQRRKEVIRNLVNRYKQTGETSTEEAEKQMKAITQDYRAQLQSSLGEEFVTKVGDNSLADREGSRSEFSGYNVSIWIRNDNINLRIRPNRDFDDDDSGENGEEDQNEEDDGKNNNQSSSEESQ